MSTHTAAPGVTPHLDSAASHSAATPGIEPGRLFLPLLMLSAFSSVFAASMLNVLLPGMKEEFGISTAQAGWIFTAYSLVYAVGVPVYGKLADTLGVRRIFIPALFVFAAGCLIAILSPGFGGVILGRVIQGVGGAALASLSMVAIATFVPDARRGAAMGMVGSMVGLGSASGPVIGGTVAEWTGWRALFAVPLVLMLALAPVAFRTFPVTGASGTRKVDIPGGVMFAIACATVLLGITQGQVEGFAAATAWGSFVISGAATTAFIMRSRRVSHPFVPPWLLANRAYRTTLLASCFASMAFLPVMIFVPLLLVNENGLTPGQAGLVLTPGAVALALIAPQAGKLTDRIGPRRPMLTGMSIVAAGSFALSTVGAGAPALVVMLAAFGVGVGSGLVGSPVNTLAARSLAPGVAGIGMGVFSGLSFLGGGAGPALFGALLDWRQAAGGAALNPLYRNDAPAYSDVFLATTAAMVIALAFARRIPIPAPASTTEGKGRAGEPGTGEGHA